MQLHQGQTRLPETALFINIVLRPAALLGQNTFDVDLKNNYIRNLTGENLICIRDNKFFELGNHLGNVLATGAMLRRQGPEKVISLITMMLT
jgi:hypothetical protein